MMRASHALSGSVAWLAAVPLVNLATPLRPWDVAVGTVACAGTALLPDFDHPSSTVAYTFGWPTRKLASLVARASGGHRHGTHSFLGAALAGLAAWATVAAGDALGFGPLAWAPLVLAFGLGLRGLGWTRSGTRASASAFVGCAVAAWAVALLGARFEWIPWAYAIGALAHIAGDLFTPQGVPLLWPYPTRLTVPLVDTNSLLERYVVVPVLVLAAGFLGLVRFGVWPYLIAA